MKKTVLSCIALTLIVWACSSSNDPKPVPPKTYDYFKESGIVLAILKEVSENSNSQNALNKVKDNLASLKTILPDGVLSRFSSDTIWVEKSGETLKYIASGNNEEHSGYLVIGDLTKYYNEVTTTQPFLLLNGIATTFYHKYMPESDKTTLKSLFDKATATKYKSVYKSNGVKLVMNQAPDAAKDVVSYFAENTEAYLGENDFYPFDYEELERYDPECHAFMETLWGKRTIEPNKDGITMPPLTLKQWLAGEESDLDLYYRKYIDADGLAILSSRFVSDEALVQAKYIINTMLERIPESKDEMLKSHFRIGIIGAYENVTDMPENRMMNVWWPDTDWDERGRGYGATEWLPLMTCGEENIIKIDNYTERYPYESIMVHEFAHNVDYGLRKGREGFEQELIAAFDNAKAKGLWANTYSMSNSEEYFAEAVQAWFDTCNMYVMIDGVNTKLKTREQLKSYDPTLYELLSKIMPDTKLEGYHFTFE